MPKQPLLTSADIKLLEEKFATKDDLKNFAAKDDLKSFATKDDLKSFATKDDLKNFATKDDLIGLAHTSEVEEIFEKHQQITDQKLDKVITILDSIVGELQATRQELITLSQHSSDHTDKLQDHEHRITRLESTISVN